MANDVPLNKCSNSICVIDFPNPFSGEDAGTRNVHLYNENTAFQIRSTYSNSEDFVIVFLDSNHVVATTEHLIPVGYADRDSSYFESFENVDQCIDFISSLDYEKVFLILFLNEAEHIIPLIHDLSQLTFTYICKEREDTIIDVDRLNWMSRYPIIRDGVHKVNDELVSCLKQDMISMRSPSKISTLLSMKTQQTSSVKPLNTHQASYQWNQLLLQALHKLPQTDESRQDILNVCKAQYSGDKSELKNIEQFEKTYQRQSAIWWYTQECFLYKLINKALQTEDIDIIFKFRFFIIDLYNELTDLHNKSKSENANILTVYRGQQVAADELEDLKFNINNVVSLKPFLSTTTNKDVALIYAGNGSERPQIESVLFEIIIDVNKSKKPFANISKISRMADEDEVLLSMSMLFIVRSVDEMDNNVWNIQLVAINESNIEVHYYYKNLNANEDYDPLLNFALLLLEMGAHEKVEKYLMMLLKEYTDHYPLIYTHLGVCCYVRNNYRRALRYYIRALNHYVVSNCSAYPVCCFLYNNIAHIYSHEEDYERALSFHHKALEIHLRYPNACITGFVRTLGSIGQIYAEVNNYDEALKNFLHALRIIESSPPNYLRYVAQIHSHLGKIHLKLGQHDKSMTHYKISLGIQQRVFQNDDQLIASDHIHIGEVYDFKGEYDEAIHHYEQAERILINRDVIGRTSLAAVYRNMGVIYRKKQEYELALHYHQKCLDLQKQFYSENSTHIAITYGCIGTVYHSMCVPEKGIEYAKMAIDCIEKCPTTDNVELARMYNNLGSCYTDLGDNERALYYYNLSLNLKYRFLPEKHPTVATTFHNIAKALLQKGDIQMAINYEEKAVKIIEDAFGINHPQYQMLMQALTLLKNLH